MKTPLYCLLTALALRVACSQSVPENDNPLQLTINKILPDNSASVARYIPEGGTLELLHNLHGNWLSICESDKTSLRKDGFNPRTTYISTKYIPVVKELPNGHYLITFVSPVHR